MPTLSGLWGALGSRRHIRTLQSASTIQAMNFIHEKGTQVNRTERSAQKPPPKIGLFATLRVSFGDQRSLTSRPRSPLHSGRLLVLSLFTTLASAVVLMAGASPALAVSAPPDISFAENDNNLHIPGHLQGYHEANIFVFSTRLFAEAQVATHGQETKWRTEYSTSKSALESGSGIVTSDGEVASSENEGTSKNILFGTLLNVNGEQFQELHRLIPATHYYAQFVAEDSAGKTVLPFEFTTSSMTKPEIANNPTEPASNELTFNVITTSPTTASFEAQVESGGAVTKYSFGYSLSPSGPVTTCAAGSIGGVEDFTIFKGNCTGLTPETIYYIHLVATNEKGTIEQSQARVISGTGGSTNASIFETPTERPVVGESDFRNVTAVSAHITDGVLTNREETHWRFEYSAGSAIGPWEPVPGGAGTISQAEAETLTNGFRSTGVTLAGLNPATTYYVRLYAENAAGEGKNYLGELISTETRGFSSFETTGPPTASTLAVHSLRGESPRIIGTVDPNSEPTSAEQTITIEGAPTSGTFTLTFNGQTTAPIAYNAPVEGPGGVRQALESIIPSDITIEGVAGGPYTVYFAGAMAGKAEPVIEADSSGLTPSGAVSVAITQHGGESYEAHYHFQYVSEEQFKNEGEWAKAPSTPEVDIGTGLEAQFVLADLTSLEAGETYRYRIVATSTFPGNPVVVGAERTLTVPALQAPESSALCPNEALRTGASANLPDCRAYEQLTPRDKEGARELFTYGRVALAAGFAIGEDGEHGMLEANVSWGSESASGQAPYFFSREASGDWRMTAASPQPETGVNHYFPEVMAPDLTSFAFESFFQTSPENESKEFEFRSGLPGGPYATGASVPVSQVGVGLGWVGASHDFSRLFLSSGDHELLGFSTGTKQDAADLYEYTAGELRQVNVTGASPGSTIGACGATVVKGDEENGTVSSAHAVSADGSRVFFEAVPGVTCSESKHLYMRVGGESTVDIGVYKFIAANSEGTKLLLEKNSGQMREISLYDTGSATVKPLFSVRNERAFKVSEDLSTIYFVSPEQLTPEAPPRVPNVLTGFIYRYDVPAEKLSFIDSAHFVTSASLGAETQLSPDGRYLYFAANVVRGVPGGLGGSTSQVYRYDSGEGLIQCMSCASPFDPEPKQTAVFGQTGGGGGLLESRTGSPRTEFASDDGDYVFFDTASALLPSDVDGEVAPEGAGGSSLEHSSFWFSISSDVYEWRKAGVDGCAHIQGCLALITNGRGGFLNLFLGTDKSGRDAFFFTNSELVPQDDDTAGDIYDARIGGGMPPVPPRPVECEGDACSTPASPPNDATPSSFTFSGSGNVVQPSSSKPTAKSKKPKPKKKPTHRKTRKKKGRKASKRGKTVKSSRRSK
jgi:hypothetical protein